MLVFSHPTGNANVRAAVKGFADAQLLTAFYTSLAAFPGNMLDRLGALSPFSEIRRRNFDPALQLLTHQWPLLEGIRLAATRMKLNKLTAHEKGLFCTDAVYRNLDKRVASRLMEASHKGAAAVYAYDDGAFHSFRRAKQLGLQCFYDLPTGHWRALRRLLEVERERWPQWATTITGLQDSEAKLERKDEELRLADRIFVASRFTANTLKDYPGRLAPVEVIPYGYPPVNDKRDYASRRWRRPLKLLFVGTLSQQKGVANLLAAVESLGRHVSLTLVGHKAHHHCAALNTALAKHNWIPSLPHAEILKLMAAHDVLVFPTLFDGFGLVMTEAMSQGTPVIASERCAGPDLITPGHDGWLMQAGATDSLRAVLEDLLHHPEKLIDAGRNARDTASRRPWPVYSQELVSAVMAHKAPKAPALTFAETK